jgi:hypothetical protein
MKAKRKADREKRKAERKTDREEVAARLEAMHDKTDANQMRLEPETEHQEKMDAWIANIKDGRKERTAAKKRRSPIQRRWSQIQEKRGPWWSGRRFLTKMLHFTP